MPNAQLAQQILEQIAANPDSFDMGTWNTGEDAIPGEPIACGTTLCVAGWAAYLTGWHVFGGSAFKDGIHQSVEYVALKALDLPDVFLFYTSEDVATEMLQQIIDGRDLSASDAENAVTGGWS